MKFIFAAAIAVTAGLIIAPEAKAELLYLGKAKGGSVIKLDTQSIRGGATTWVGFTYYLGGRRIAADADCKTEQWEEAGTLHIPQSQATKDMIAIVCSAWAFSEDDPMGDYARFLVFDPPSNVRSQPNGSIKCSLSEKQVVLAYLEPQNNWYLTQACGGGWIHQSQLRPFD